MNVPWWRTQLGDEEADAARNAVAEGRLSQGKLTQELEERFAEALDVPFATLTTSGTVALTMAFVSAGIGPGDEVIVPNRTFIATAHAAQILGCEVVLVDTCADLPVMDPDDVRAAITSKTRAVVPVHLNGSPCDIRALRALSDEHDLILIEDAAQALFSRVGGRCMGTFGDFGCYSLGVTKLMTAGQGGLVVTHDAERHEKLQFLRSHGVHSPLAETFDSFGYNFRYTDIQAAIASRQLDRCPRKIDAHLALYRRYRDALQGSSHVQIVDADLDGGTLPLWVEATCEDRDGLIAFLEERGIQARKATPNLSRSPHLTTPRQFPNAERFESTLVTLPSGPDQDPAGIEWTIESLLAFESR